MVGRTAKQLSSQILKGGIIIARPRKIVEADKFGNKFAGALPDAWWRWKADSSDESEDVNNDDIKDTIVIYTTQDLKIKLQPMGNYSYPNGEQAFQYNVEEGSPEHKQLFDLLKLDASHEKKPVRKKRITKVEKLAQEAAKIGTVEVKKRKRRKAE